MFFKTLDDNFLTQMGIDLENRMKIITAKQILKEKNESIVCIPTFPLGLGSPSSPALPIMVENCTNNIDPNEEFREYVINSEFCSGIKHKLIAKEDLSNTEHSSVVKAGVKFLIDKHSL
jgi:hypothetical protein